MPPLSDPIVLAQLRAVLENWRFTGYVAATDRVLEWMAERFAGLTLKDLALVMFQHLQTGGRIDQVAETRPEWTSYAFHYDFRLPVRGRFTYIETVLDDDEPDDPTLHIVSIHDV